MIIRSYILTDKKLEVEVEISKNPYVIYKIIIDDLEVNERKFANKIYNLIKDLVKSKIKNMKENDINF